MAKDTEVKAEVAEVKSVLDTYIESFTSGFNKALSSGIVTNTLTQLTCNGNPISGVVKLVYTEDTTGFTVKLDNFDMNQVYTDKAEVNLVDKGVSKLVLTALQSNKVSQRLFNAYIAYMSLNIIKTRLPDSKALTLFSLSLNPVIQAGLKIESVQLTDSNVIVDSDSLNGLIRLGVNNLKYHPRVKDSRDSSLDVFTVKL